MSLHSDTMDIFAAETMKMLGWESPTKNLMRMDSLSINTAYPTDNKTDYVYFLTSPTDDPINRQIIDNTVKFDEGSDTGTNIIQTCRTFRTEWQIYGENSSDNAEKIALELLTNREIGNDLSKHGISIVPDIAAPIFAPETLGQQWIHRYIVSCNFNALVQIERSVNRIESVNISLVSYEGVEDTCSI